MTHPPASVLPLDRPSFETVYTVGLSFLRQALRWLGVAERDLDDVLQDVMLAAYRALDSFDPARGARGARDDEPRCERGLSVGSKVPRDASAPCEPLKRWLFGIAWRQAGHYRDRAHRRREVAVGAGTSWPFDVADPSPSSEQLLAREESGAIVGRLLGQIELERRLVLIMHDLLDLSIAEIARELDVKENTARNRLRLAREDVRVAMKRMNAERRRALRSALALRVAELSVSLDEESLMRAARGIPEAPAHVRQRIWTALERAILDGQPSFSGAHGSLSPSL
jgi:RNA polymerase sigma-70 factor (ECF subfamily)